MQSIYGPDRTYKGTDGSNGNTTVHPFKTSEHNNTLSGKSMVLSASTTHKEAIVLEGKSIEEVDFVSYLGSILDTKVGTEAAI